MTYPVVVEVFVVACFHSPDWLSCDVHLLIVVDPASEGEFAFLLTPWPGSLQRAEGVHLDAWEEENASGVGQHNPVNKLYVVSRSVERNNQRITAVFASIPQTWTRWHP